MTVSLYMDQHVHAAVTSGLRDRGIDVLTTLEDGTADWNDEQLLERASQLNRIVFTQDRDFLVLTHQWQYTKREFAGLVYGHQLDLTIGRAVRDLELIASVSDPDDLRNRIEFIPL